MFGFGDNKVSDGDFEVAIEREIFPPDDQGRDRHYDNLKIIRAWALENPDRFYKLINRKSEKGLKDHLTAAFSKVGGDDVNSLMWGSDEWEMHPKREKDKFGYARGGMTGAMSEEDMALAHKASRGETGLRGAFQGSEVGDLDRLGVKYDQNDPMRQVVGASIKLIDEFMPEIDKELKMAFLQGDLQTKAQLLQEHANDTDDRLWRSNEWMFLERALGEGTPDDIYDRSMEGKQGGGLDSFGYGTTRG